MLQSNALIVDTSLSMRSYVRTILHQELSFDEIHEAQDAEDAHRLIKSGQVIHWIFSSLEMPGLSGFDLLEIARNHPDSAHARFVLMSSNDTHITREIAIRKGAADYLSKPFAPSHLINMVHRLTGLTERRSAARSRCTRACEIDIGFDAFHSYGAELADISLTGCRLKTSQLQPGSGHVDDYATVALHPEGNPPFQIQGQIKRVQINPSLIDPLRKTEMAVEFIDLTPQLIAALGKYIDQCTGRVSTI